jgi:hypothetical protein
VFRDQRHRAREARIAPRDRAPSRRPPH